MFLIKTMLFLWQVDETKTKKTQVQLVDNQLIALFYFPHNHLTKDNRFDIFFVDPIIYVLSDEKICFKTHQ